MVLGKQVGSQKFMWASLEPELEGTPVFYLKYKKDMLSKIYQKNCFSS